MLSAFALADQGEWRARQESDVPPGSATGATISLRGSSGRCHKPRSRGESADQPVLSSQVTGGVPGQVTGELQSPCRMRGLRVTWLRDRCRRRRPASCTA